VSDIKSSTKTFASLLQDTGLDPDSEVIVWAILSMDREKKAADNAKAADKAKRGR
jgi:precorrin-6B methylase 1